MSEAESTPRPRRFRLRSLRARMSVYSTLLVLLPAVATAAVALAMGLLRGQQQVGERLDLVATSKEEAIYGWVGRLQQELSALLSEQELLRSVQLALQAKEDLQRYSVPALERLFGERIQRSPQIEQLSLLDLDGQTVATSDATQAGALHGDAQYFLEGLQGPYVHPPFYSELLSRTVVIVSQPAPGEQGETVGVLLAYARVESLGQIMLQRAGLGVTGEAFLLDASYARLTPARVDSAPRQVQTEGARAAIGEQRSGSGSYSSYWGGRVIAAYRWLPDLELALLVEQEEAEAFSAVYAALGLSLGVALVAVLIAIGVSFLATRSITTPLYNLTQAAGAIAGGDLEHPIPAAGEDEIGTMARAFASMTGQMRGLIGNLEQRVEERTAELDQALQQVRQEAATREELLRTIRAMSSPVIPIMKGIMVMPLIGVLDSERAQRAVESLLAAVERERARVVILDVTGLALVDTAVAKSLLDAARSAELLGAHTILVGITAEVAATLVHLGVELEGLRTAATLEQGLAVALRIRGR